EDKIYKDRLSFLENNNISIIRKRKNIKDFVPKSIRRSINRIIGRKDYIDLVNDQLLKEQVIRKRMSADEIWSVTDIHVQTKGNLTKKGISMEFLKWQLTSFHLINQR